MFLRIFRFLLLFCLLICGKAGYAQARSSNPVLVLVEPDRFDPKVNPDMYVHPTWVRWPEEAKSGSHSRLLSVFSGLDWYADEALFRFDHVGNGQTWRSSSFGYLTKAGYFETRVGLPSTLLSGLDGNVRRPAMLLDLSGKSSTIESIPLDGDWPASHVMLLAASGGEDVSAVLRRTSGRVLVVEYPPRAGQNWSRIWLLGRDVWPLGSPIDSASAVPGLVEAHSLGRLLQEPGSVQWEWQRKSWPGANRWFETVQGVWLPFVVTFGLLGLGLVLVGGFLAAREVSSAPFSTFLRLFFLCFPALLIGGNLANLGGLTGTWIWSGVALGGLFGLANLPQLALPDPGSTRSLWTYTALAWICFACVNPTYSIFSPEFLPNGPILSLAFLGSGSSGSAVLPFAGMTAALAVTLAKVDFVRNYSGTLPERKGYPLEAAAICFAAFIGLSLLLRPWWAMSGFGPLLWWSVPIGLALGSRRLVLALFACSLLPGIFELVRHGLCFVPFGLIASTKQIGSLNVYEWVRFFASPSFLGSVLLLGVGWIFSPGFLVHRVKMEWRRNPAAQTLTLTALAALAGGFIYPMLFAVGLVCTWSTAFVLLDALIRPAPPLD